MNKLSQKVILSSSQTFSNALLCKPLNKKQLRANKIVLSITQSAFHEAMRCKKSQILQLNAVWERYPDCGWPLPVCVAASKASAVLCYARPNKPRSLFCTFVELYLETMLTLPKGSYLPVLIRKEEQFATGLIANGPAARIGASKPFAFKLISHRCLCSDAGTNDVRACRAATRSRNKSLLHGSSYRKFAPTGI